MEKINDEDFEKKLKENKKSLVLFSADWCGPCKVIKPMINDISKEMEGDFTFFVLDVNESSKTTERYNVKNIPTGIIIIEGEEKERFTGAKNREQIKNMINNFLS